LRFHLQLLLRLRLHLFLLQEYYFLQDYLEED
jgi:hypothetical protein